MIGTWQYDAERTKSELVQNAQTPLALIKCYEKKLCGDGAFTYSETDWWQSSSAVFEVPGPKTPYVIRNISKDRIEIRTKSQDEETDSAFIFINHDENYVEQNFNGFVWREYFRRDR